LKSPPGNFKSRRAFNALKREKGFNKIIRFIEWVGAGFLLGLDPENKVLRFSWKIQRVLKPYPTSSTLVQ